MWPVLLLANPSHYKAIVEFHKSAEGLNNHSFRRVNCRVQIDTQSLVLPNSAVIGRKDDLRR